MPSKILGGGTSEVFNSRGAEAPACKVGPMEDLAKLSSRVATRDHGHQQAVVIDLFSEVKFKPACRPLTSPFFSAFGGAGLVGVIFSSFNKN